MSRNKYNADRRKFRGVSYHSEFEVDVVRELYKQKNSKGRNNAYKFEYEVDAFDYTLRRKYLPDFKITRSDGSIIYIEVKGMLDRDAKAKLLAAREQNPDLTVVILFLSNALLYKGAKSRYSDWAEKHGFDYAIRSIPERWLFV